MKHRLSRSLPVRGFTLIELMVTVGIVGVLIALVGPSFQRFIATQRLRAMNSALITDLQYARSESASRNKPVKLKFDKTGATYTCYVIFVGNKDDCDCNNTPGANVCINGTVELRTVRIERSSSMTVEVPDDGAAARSDSIAFNPATGRLEVLYVDLYEPPTEPYPIDLSNASIGGFHNQIEVTGRPSSCSPSGRLQGVTPCP